MATTEKAFPFTADEMRSQLPLAATIFNEGFDVGGIAFEGHIRLAKAGRNPGAVIVSMPEKAVLIPVDEWKEMIAWVAKHEKPAPPPAEEAGAP